MTFWTPSGKMIGREKPYGDHYYQITQAGLTREDTYVAIYGEWTNILSNWWRMYGHDELLQKALINSDARAHMKYPDFDDDGFRAMRMEGVIESRGPAYPDNVGYGVRWNGGHGLDMARLKRWMDETPGKYARCRSGRRIVPWRTDAFGYAQQMPSMDNQYLPLAWATADDMNIPADYAYVKAQKLDGRAAAKYQPALVPSRRSGRRSSAAGLPPDADYQPLRLGGRGRRRRSAARRRPDAVRRPHHEGQLGRQRPRAHPLHDADLGPAGDGRAGRAVRAERPLDGAGRPGERAVHVRQRAAEGTHQALAGEVLPVASQPNVQEPNPADTPYTATRTFIRCTT